MSNVVVGIGGMAIAKPGEILVTYALGSCVGICLYDDTTKIAGMAHILLPNSQGFDAEGEKAYKFADIAILKLIELMIKSGARKSNIKAKIAGGAQMFASMNSTLLMDIGKRNVEATKSILAANKIPVIKEDTGKNYGRTQYLDPENGIMTIKSANKGIWEF